jgi:hypothetical protein
MRAISCRARAVVPFFRLLCIAFVWVVCAEVFAAPQGGSGAMRIFRDGLEPTPGAPVVEFTRVGSSGPLGQGSDLALAWRTEGADGCDAYQNGPTLVREWFVVPGLQSAGHLVKPTGAGRYLFDLTCYNASGATTRTLEVDFVPHDGRPRPTLTVANNGRFAAGESVSGEWYSDGATACNASEQGPTPLGFAGTRDLLGQFSHTGQRAGVYALSMGCSGSGGGHTVTRHAIIETAPGCDDPLIMPAGRRVEDWSFTAAFAAPDGYPLAYYPNSVDYFVPVGARREGITSIRIDPDAVPIQRTVALTWTRVQPLPIDGYPTPLPATGMYFSLSRCRGDVRPAVPGAAGDAPLGVSCRGFTSEGTLYYSTGAGSVDVCKLPPGEPYWINVMPADPADGLAPGESTCENASHARCHVGALHRAL